MLKVLPIEVEGKIFGRLIVPPATFKDYQKWKDRRETAFGSVEKLLRAFAKAA